MIKGFILILNIGDKISFVCGKLKVSQTFNIIKVFLNGCKFEGDVSIPYFKGMLLKQIHHFLDVVISILSLSKSKIISPNTEYFSVLCSSKRRLNNFLFKHLHASLVVFLYLSRVTSCFWMIPPHDWFRFISKLYWG